MSRFFIPTLSAIAVLLLGSTAKAQYELPWFTVDGGGAMSSVGGSFELAGTIGQADASSSAVPMAGGTFELVGGFWQAAPTCTCAGDLNGDGLRDGRDIQEFVECLTVGGACACADMNDMQGVSLADVTPFINDLLSAPICP